MPPEGTKRKAATSSGGGGGNGAGGAKAAKGRAAKGKHPTNPPKASPPTKAAKPKTPSSGTSVGSSGAPGATLYAVKCSRTTRVALISNEALTDPYGDETTETAELINKKAVRMDGTWFWSGPGSRAPKKGPAPGLVLYRSKAAANKAGEKAWAELMQGHPFDCRVAGNEDQLEEFEDADEYEDDGEDEDSDEDEYGGAYECEGEGEYEDEVTGVGARRRKRRKRAAAAADDSGSDSGSDSDSDVEHDDGASDADPDDFKTMAPGGLAAWVRREKFLYCPYNEGTPNIVSSKAKVEVVGVVVK
ncbi:hypothetical protein MNEG_12414 [Monoraphidium neglectum]|uniref:Uncharacterized protein n=1 Tax=Monoraphidium neglectum TaxID=145388 RepID=A0A0D2LVG5_9CHLO|nr:hypothetical protein MNEG_12414 [Monoraphidium neglectum]KIY95549.1 hypothetical protein MNEG_12414 [Monoraphidium neglectum]|eukprot:XP_013894569.1 hypothetical protein MNEG_12414 [Monoraphidium neglectum]